MRVLRARNVNDLYVQGMELLANHGVAGPSRAGPVVIAPWPVMSVYENPCERVLFDETRDANPFFHLMEGLWMLAGRNDSAFLNRYIPSFGERFGEPSGVIHGAYGHRWRNAMGYDQIDRIVQKLRENPNDRQCVLQMWDSSDWLAPELNDSELCGHDDLLGDWKDRPCNTHVYFRVQTGNKFDVSGETVNTVPDNVLDMTILCRSNDIVFGAYGANAVHFSMLMEYVAGRVGCGVGTMFQLSNNYHGYVDVMDRLGDPTQLPDRDLYDDGTLFPMSMANDWDKWDIDLGRFMRWHDNENMMLDRGPDNTANTWFQLVAVPMAIAYQLHRMGSTKAALVAVDDIVAKDWHQACRAWMMRRLK